jgi:DnaK suppressor protein
MMAESEEQIDRRKRLRDMLLQKREEIQARIAEELGEKMTEDIASTLGPALDEGDLSTLEVGRDLDYALLTMYTKTLQNVEHALERLEEGSYGICEECGREIGEKRLQAMSFARYCVNCQREKEKSMEMDKGRRWMGRRAQNENRQPADDEDS